MAPATTAAEYILPNNDSEWERLDYQHKLLLRTFGGLYCTPLNPSKIKRVLDIGCGTGQWAMTFAEQQPQVEVVGLDIATNPGWNNASPNCNLRVADLELDETWTELGTFDFIHGRFVTPGVKDWPKLLQRCHEHLTIGGFVEFQEMAFPLQCMEQDVDQSTSKILRLGRLVMEVWRKCGLEPRECDLMPGQLAKLGFGDVKYEDFKMMIGPWAEDDEGKELGLMGQRNLMMGLPGFAGTLFMKYLGWTQEERDEFVRECREEMRQPTLRTWLPLWVCYATKER